MNYFDRASGEQGLAAGVRVRVALDVLELSARLSSGLSSGAPANGGSSKRVGIHDVRIDSKGCAVVPRASGPEHLTTLLWEVLAAKACETDDTPWADPATDLHEDVLAVLASLSVRQAESPSDLYKRFARGAEHVAATRKDVALAMGPISQRGINSSQIVKPVNTPVVPRDRDQSMPTIPAPALTVQALVDMTAKTNAKASTDSASKAAPQASAPKPPSPKVAVARPLPAVSVPRVSALKTSIGMGPLLKTPAASATGLPKAPTASTKAAVPPTTSSPTPPKAFAPLQTRLGFGKLAGSKPSVARVSTPEVGASSTAPPVTLDVNDNVSADNAASDRASSDLVSNDRATPQIAEPRSPEIALPHAHASQTKASVASLIESSLTESPSAAELGTAQTPEAPQAGPVATSVNDAPQSHAVPVVLVSQERFSTESTFSDAEVPVFVTSPRRKRAWLISGISIGGAVLLLIWAAQQPRGQALLGVGQKADAHASTGQARSDVVPASTAVVAPPRNNASQDNSVESTDQHPKSDPTSIVSASPQAGRVASAPPPRPQARAFQPRRDSTTSSPSDSSTDTAPTPTDAATPSKPVANLPTNPDAPAAPGGASPGVAPPPAPTGAQPAAPGKASELF